MEATVTLAGVQFSGKMVIIPILLLWVSFGWQIALIVIGANEDSACSEIDDLSTDQWLLVGGAVKLAPIFLFALLISITPFLLGLMFQGSEGVMKCIQCLQCLLIPAAILLGLFNIIWFAIGIATVAECFDTLNTTLKVFSLIELVLGGLMLIQTVVGCIQKRKQKE